VLIRAWLASLVTVLCTAAGFGLGWLLDGIAESRPLLTLFFTLTGLVVAVAVSWSLVRRSPRSAER
jgi:F0F1-type ATP synthase assembly protein I